MAIKQMQMLGELFFLPIKDVKWAVCLA